MKKYCILFLAIFLAKNVLSQNTFPATGNAGIGTTSPTGNLHIKSDIANQLILQRATAGALFSGVSFVGYNGVELGSFKLDQASGEHRWYVGGSYFPTIYSNGLEVMRIGTTGNVGIGTTTPSFLLDVNGTARFQTRSITGTTAVGSGVQATDKILTDGGIRGVTYINFRGMGTGDAVQTGIWNSGNSLVIYTNNVIGPTFSGANGGVTSGNAVSYSVAYNPGASTGDVSFINYIPQFAPSANTSINYYGLIVNPAWQSPSFSNSLIGVLRGYYFNNLLYTTSTANDVRAIETNGGKIIFSGTVQQAVSGLARGTQLTQNIPAAANNDVLIGLDIAPTFANGSFTNVSNIAMRVTGKVMLVTLPNDNTQTRVLVSDANGNISYRDATTLGGGGSGWALNGTTVGALSTLGTINNFDLPIITNNTERMRIGANGSVGIGTTAINDVNYKLFVETGIRTRKIKVDQGAWPDYVFEPSYSLLPIADLKSFIAKEKHLPGAPSAEEVKKEGVDIGDNQALLLKKIEELTLYLIHDHEEIQELKKKNEELEKLIQSKK